MLYLITLKAQNKLTAAPVQFVEAFRNGIAEAIAKGKIKSACAKVGGGIVLIVDSPSNAHLTAELRKHQIVDAEVIPLVPLVELLDAHIEFKKTGKHEL